MFPFCLQIKGQKIPIHDQTALDICIKEYGEEVVTSTRLDDWRMYDMPVYSTGLITDTNTLAKRISDFSSWSCDNNKHHQCGGMAQEYFDKVCYCSCHVRIIRIKKGTEMTLLDGRNSKIVLAPCDIERETYLSLTNDYLLRLDNRPYRIEKSAVTVIKERGEIKAESKGT